MTYETNYLVHYGIHDQKWHVRRFQNPDGSLTEAGRKRYAKSFDDTKKNVFRRMSNRANPISKNPIDIDSVKKRGNLSDEEAKECTSLANSLYDRLAEQEPKITKDVVSSVSQAGSKMHGLDNRMKQPTSLAAKIGADAKEKDLTFEQSANGIRDVIRYTSVSDDDNFVSSYNSVKKSLEEKGYKESVCKNYFKMYQNGEVKHKSVQCVFVDKDGNKFEIQFQTPSSQAAKELRTPLYEARRSSGLTKKQKADLEKQMEELAELVAYPPNVMSIRSH